MRGKVSIMTTVNPNFKTRPLIRNGLNADPDLDPTIYVNADQDSDLGFGNTLILKISTFLRFLFSQSFLSFSFLRFLFSKFNISYLKKISTGTVPRLL